jgi:hypothetical protein
MNYDEYEEDIIEDEEEEPTQEELDTLESDQHDSNTRHNN